MKESVESAEIRKEKSQNWSLDIALFLLYTGWYLSTSLVTNQILKQTCLVKFGYNETICSSLDDESTHDVEQEIQPYVANILMTVNICVYSISSVLCLFLGPWSDRYGRKKVLNFLYSGYSITMAGFVAVSWLSKYYEMSPWYYFFAQIPFMIVGAWPTLIVIHLCYMADQTDESNRSTRLTVMELAIFGGRLLGSASSSFVLQYTSPTIVFSISLGILLCGTLLVILFAEESVEVKYQVKLWKQYKELFKPMRVKELFATFVQKKQPKRRRILWSLIAILMVVNFTTTGSNTVFYLFTRQTFGWTLREETLYESATMLMNILGGIVSMILLKRIFKLSDNLIAAISTISLVVDALIKSFATQPWQLYMASAVALLKMVYGPMLKSIMVTIISPSEIGASYSVTQAIETASGFASSPVYARTYAATIANFPGAFNLITAGVIAFTLIISFLISRWLKSPVVVRKTEVE